MPKNPFKIPFIFGTFCAATLVASLANPIAGIAMLTLASTVVAANNPNSIKKTSDVILNNAMIISMYDGKCIILPAQNHFYSRSTEKCKNAKDYPELIQDVYDYAKLEQSSIVPPSEPSITYRAMHIDLQSGGCSIDRNRILFLYNHGVSYVRRKFIIECNKLSQEWLSILKSKLVEAKDIDCLIITQFEDCHDAISRVGRYARNTIKDNDAMSNRKSLQGLLEYAKDELPSSCSGAVVAKIIHKIQHCIAAVNLWSDGERYNIDLNRINEKEKYSFNSKYGEHCSGEALDAQVIGLWEEDIHF